MTKSGQPIRSSGGVVVRESGGGWKVALLYKNGCWVLPKGRIEIGEREEQTALREVREELGISQLRIVDKEKLGYMCYVASQAEDDFLPRPKAVSVFLVETGQKAIKPLKKDGFAKAEWFLLEEALRIVKFPDLRVLLFKALIFLQKRGKIQPIIKTAAVSVGGEGERIRNFVKKKKVSSKLLLPIGQKPFLGYILDTLLDSDIGLDDIYLLTSRSHSYIEQFVLRNYAQCDNIKIIYTRARTVPQAVYSMVNIVDKPFLYMDGDILSNVYLFREIINQHTREQPLVSFAVSHQNLAPTHLQVRIDKKKIIDSFSGLFIQREKRNRKEFFCSMGIFVVDHRIFDVLPDLIYFYDLDLVLDLLIKAESEHLILPYVYKGEWQPLHNEKDYRLIVKKKDRIVKKL